MVSLLRHPLGRICARAQFLELSSKRYFSGSEEDDSKLRQAASKVAEELGSDNKTGVKKKLFKKFAEISEDTYKEATSAQYSEFLASARKTAQNEEKPIIPSRAASMRLSADASQALRKEAFYKLRTMGLSAIEANKKAEEIYQKSYAEFLKQHRKSAEDATLSLSKQRPKPEDQRKVRNLMLDQMRELFGDADLEMEGDKPPPPPPRERPPTRQYLSSSSADFSSSSSSSPNVESVFRGTQNPLNIFDMDALRTNHLGFWRELDAEKAAIVNQGMGPTNAFQEQIEWTKKGKMWPYPINNEYMMGDEENVSFVEHVFLEPEWAKHKVPKSKAVERFMELVLVGLSKNPYMPIAKKREHIAWFANYFKEVIPGKYKSLL